jgi:hypothetical protein
MLEDLLSRTLDLAPIAARHDLDVESLGSWAARPEIAAALERVRRLADQRADLIVSRARTGAAHALLSLATTGEGETARRACVDLLKLGGPGAALSEREGEAVDPREDIEALHSLLDKLGTLAAREEEEG